MSTPPKLPDLRSPRMWIYVVMIVGGMIWGMHFIVTTIANAR